MRLVNRTKYGFSHVLTTKGKAETYTIAAGCEAEVPKAVADIWLKIDGITETLSPEEIEKAKAEAIEAERAKVIEEVKAQIGAEYEAKIAKLQEEIEKAKAAK